MECNAFQRSIPPRFIIRSIYAQILSEQYIIIILIHDTVTTIQVARNEYHLHFILRTVAHSKIFQHIQHLVMRHVMQPMGNERHFKRSIKILLTFQTFLQIFTRITYPTGDIDKRQHILMQVLIPVQAVQRFQKYVDSFILKLISSTGSDN